MKCYLMQQTSPEWWEVKRAVPSASDFDKIITPAKGQLSESRGKYIAELLEDAAMSDAAYFSKYGVYRGTVDMQNGQDREAEARKWYAAEMDEDVQQVGFCMNDAETYGCSPDGVIGLVLSQDGMATVKGILELKCPKLSTQFRYLLAAALPLEYKVQVHGQLAVTGAEYAHFVSYAPGAQMLVVRVEPDEFTVKVKAAIEEFVAELLETAKKLGVILKRKTPVVGLAEGELEPAAF